MAPPLYLYPAPEFTSGGSGERIPQKAMAERHSLFLRSPRLGRRPEYAAVRTAESEECFMEKKLMYRIAFLSVLLFSVSASAAGAPAPDLSLVELPDGFSEYMESLDEDRYLAKDPWHYQIFYLSTHPDASVPGYGTPWYEEEEIFPESLPPDIDNINYNYVNRQIVFPYDGKGGTVTIGTDRDPEGGGIRLSAEASCPLPGCRFGFRYTVRDVLSLRIVTDGSEPGSLRDPANAPYGNFLLTGDTFDTLVPSSADSGGPDGVFWAGWEPDTVYLRVLDLTRDRLLASLYIKIDRDPSGAFAVTEVGNTADLATLTEEEKEALTDAAVRQFFPPVSDTETGPAGSDCGRGFPPPDAATDRAMHEDSMIEYLPQIVPAYVRLPGTNRAVHRSALAGYGPFYAVTFHAPEYGRFTVYFTAGPRILPPETGTGAPVLADGPVPVALEIPYTETRAEYERFLSD